jgi:hypothetical protein
MISTEENKKREQEFHKGRRMFMIINNKLFIAPKNNALSHQEWAESENLLDEGSDFNDIVRGFVDSEGVYFYKGKNFTINEDAEKIFFSKLDEIINKMMISPNSHIFSEMIKQDKMGKWPAKNDYGAINDFIK